MCQSPPGITPSLLSNHREGVGCLWLAGDCHPIENRGLHRFILYSLENRLGQWCSRMGLVLGLSCYSQQINDWTLHLGSVVCLEQRTLNVSRFEYAIINSYCFSAIIPANTAVCRIPNTQLYCINIVSPPRLYSSMGKKVSNYIKWSVLQDLLSWHKHLPSLDTKIKEMTGLTPPVFHTKPCIRW